MASTNKTSHYDLSQFLADDKPGWLTDVNSDMLKIDTGIFEAKTSADGASSSATTAMDAAQAAQTAATDAKAAAESASTNAAQAKADAATALTTATNAQTTANTANTNATTAQTTATAAATAASNAQTTATNAETLANNVNSTVSALTKFTFLNKNLGGAANVCYALVQQGSIPYLGIFFTNTTQRNANAMQISYANNNGRFSFADGIYDVTIPCIGTGVATTSFNVPFTITKSGTTITITNTGIVPANIHMGGFNVGGVR